MRGNQIRGNPVCPDTDLKAFDRLPGLLRHALWYTLEDWSAIGVSKILDELVYHLDRDEGKACAGIIRLLAETEPEQTYLVYGPDHPEADSYGRDLTPANNACWSPKELGVAHA